MVFKSKTLAMIALAAMESEGILSRETEPRPTKKKKVLTEADKEAINQAQLKRERKNAKRISNIERSNSNNPTRT